MTDTNRRTQETPQADSQPAPVRDYPPLPDFETVEQHIYGACRRYITQDMLEPIHNLIRDVIDADRAAQQGYDAARLEIDHLRGATKMMEPAGEYPPLPEPKFARVVDGIPCITLLEHGLLMRTALASAAPAPQLAPAPSAIADLIAGSDFECAANPTHWMPLPAPPIKEENK